MKKKYWIDIDNSPHVLFYNPIIRELKKNGIEVIVTAREYAQVYQLLDLFKIEHIKIGRHPGKNKFLKILKTIHRSFSLASLMRKQKIDLAISNGVRAQIIAAKILGLKSVIALDYEFAQPLPFFNVDYAIVPEAIKNSDRTKKGIKTLFIYKGIKEDVYVPEFVPDLGIKKELDIDFNKVIITIRPPATLAHYYTAKSSNLFTSLIDFLADISNTIIIITPRTPEQGDQIAKERKKEIDQNKIVILNKVFNGLDLISISDLVISGGGTMIREAAAMGVPAYSIFGGKIGGVDKYLEEMGRLVLIDSEKDIREKIVIQKRENDSFELLNNNNILKQIIKFLINIDT